MFMDLRKTVLARRVTADSSTVSTARIRNAASAILRKS